MYNTYEKKTNFFGGLIGAVIGAAIGAVIWMFVAKAGYVLSILGLVIAVLSAMGYDICKGPKNAARTIIIILCVVLAVVGGSYGALYWQIDELYNEAFGVYGGAGLISKDQFRENFINSQEFSDLFTEYVTKGLGFAALGCAGVIASGIRGRKKRKAEEEALAQAAYEQSMAEGYAEPAYYTEESSPVESAPAAAEYAPAPAAYAVEEKKPAYSAPADSSYSAGYKFSSMRTAAPAKPAAPARPAAPTYSAPAPASAAKKNPFVKPEFADNFNAGKVASKEPAKPANGSHTFYSDK